MAQAGWFLNGSWIWLLLCLPSLALAIPFTSGREEHRP